MNSALFIWVRGWSFRPGEPSIFNGVQGGFQLGSFGLSGQVNPPSNRFKGGLSGQVNLLSNEVQGGLSGQVNLLSNGVRGGLSGQVSQLSQ